MKWLIVVMILFVVGMFVFVGYAINSCCVYIDEHGLKSVAEEIWEGND